MGILNKSSRALIFGGLFFIVPLLLIIFAWTQIHKTLKPISAKISEALDLNSVFGSASIIIVTIILLIILCFVAGLLIEKGIVKNWSSGVEKKLFIFMPSLQMLKFRLIGDNNNVINEFWQAIIFKEDSFYRIGFITDKTKTHTTIYIPDAPKIDAGEVRYMTNSDFEYYNISMKAAMSAIYAFGEGLDVETIIANSKKTN